RRSPASASLHARAGPGGPARKGRPRYRSVPPTARGPAADVPVVRETGGAAAARMRPGCPGGSEIDDDHAARGRFLFALFPRLLPGSVGDRDGDFQHRALALDAPFGLFLLLSLHPIDDESIEHGHVLLPSTVSASRRLRPLPSQAPASWMPRSRRRRAGRTPVASSFCPDGPFSLRSRPSD